MAISSIQWTDYTFNPWLGCSFAQLPDGTFIPECFHCYAKTLDDAGADQAAALAIPARIHFLSCEPMLRPLDETHAARFDWIIFGGESGSKARENREEWLRAGVKFCRANGVKPFVKQFGSNCIVDNGNDWPSRYKFIDSHGGDMAEWPEDLRVREFPVSKS